MIKLEELMRFYKEKNISAGCTTCGRPGWILAEAPDANTSWSLGSARDDGNTVFPAPSLPTVVMVCQHCFTLRTHAALPIRDWLKAEK